mmetsp:Transcript_15536/g.46905  ORF Transcript_15536/g.46905 Transcript_15536/m.46905 type:complete len:343 (-) Transcript_15536:962-1990(-)
MAAQPPAPAHAHLLRTLKREALYRRTVWPTSCVPKLQSYIASLGQTWPVRRLPCRLSTAQPRILGRGTHLATTTIHNSYGGCRISGIRDWSSCTATGRRNDLPRRQGWVRCCTCYCCCIWWPRTGTGRPLPQRLSPLEQSSLPAASIGAVTAPGGGTRWRRRRRRDTWRPCCAVWRGAGPPPLPGPPPRRRCSFATCSRRCCAWTRHWCDARSCCRPRRWWWWVRRGWRACWGAAAPASSRGCWCTTSCCQGSWRSCAKRSFGATSSTATGHLRPRTRPPPPSRPRNLCRSCRRRRSRHAITLLAAAHVEGGTNERHDLTYIQQTRLSWGPSKGPVPVRNDA